MGATTTHTLLAGPLISVLEEPADVGCGASVAWRGRRGRILYVLGDTGTEKEAAEQMMSSSARRRISRGSRLERTLFPSLIAFRTGVVVRSHKSIL